MSRSYKNFHDSVYEKPLKGRKNLRYNGREAFDYFSNNDQDDYESKALEKSSVFIYRGVGRGVRGESSN